MPCASIFWSTILDKSISFHCYMFGSVVSPRFLMSHKCIKWILLTHWGPDKRMVDFLETTFSDLKMNQIMLWPKKWQAIAWTNDHLGYRRIYVSPRLNEWTHSGLVTHICQWIRQPVAYCTKKVNPGLAKLNGCLAKLELTSLVK